MESPTLIRPSVRQIIRRNIFICVLLLRLLHHSGVKTSQERVRESEQLRSQAGRAPRLPIRPFVYVHPLRNPWPLSTCHKKIRNHGTFWRTEREPGCRNVHRGCATLESLRHPVRVLCLCSFEQRRWAGIYFVWINVTLYRLHTEVDVAKI